MHGLLHARRHNRPGRNRAGRNRPEVFEGRPSRVYDFVSRRLVRVLYRRIAADIAQLAPANAQVLDVGTGPGVLLVELAALRPDLRLTGIDLSADMVASAQRNLQPYADRAGVQVGDVTRLPFEEHSFDLIVSSLSLHHWDDPEAAVPELARVLRPGGRVQIYDFPFAPFERLTTAAREGSVLSGRSPRVPIRTGVAFLPCVRYVMST
jgi:ubiquinone/menaquinone biosynthesis C-methylase UbiE